MFIPPLHDTCATLMTSKIVSRNGFELHLLAVVPHTPPNGFFCSNGLDIVANVCETHWCFVKIAHIVISVVLCSLFCMILTQVFLTC